MQNAATVFQAIRTGDLDLLRDIVGADPTCAAARDASGMSALMHARYAQRTDMVEALLTARPPLDVFEAGMLGDHPRLDEILDGDSAAARAWSADGFTSLHLAAYFGQPAAVETLLEAGADARAVSRNGMKLSPIHSAIAARRKDIARILLAGGADPNVRQAGGWTPLHSAAHQGDVEAVDLLLAHGADPRLRSDDGRDAAAMAAEAKHEALAQRLAD
jgi:ankyrin repeat protein